MLDQNTDRMWFVIGAVIVGAAIIFIANGTLPTLFASVGGSFEEISNKGLEVIENIDLVSTNMLQHHSLIYERWIDSHGAEASNANGAYYASSGYIPVHSGDLYTFATPSATYSKYIAYYDKNYVFIPESHEAANGVTLETMAPSNADYARMSTRVKFQPGDEHVNKGYAPAEEWWYGLTKDYKE